MLTWLLASPLFLQMWDRDHMYGDDRDWARGIFMLAMMLLFWGGVAALAIWAVKSSSGRPHAPAGPSPIDIARERYARGEISDEEFERIKRGLAGG